MCMKAMLLSSLHRAYDVHMLTCGCCGEPMSHYSYNNALVEQTRECPFSLTNSAGGLLGHPDSIPACLALCYCSHDAAC